LRSDQNRQIKLNSFYHLQWLSRNKAWATILMVYEAI